MSSLDAAYSSTLTLLLSHFPCSSHILPEYYNIQLHYLDVSSYTFFGCLICHHIQWSQALIIVLVQPCYSLQQLLCYIQCSDNLIILFVLLCSNMQQLPDYAHLPLICGHILWSEALFVSFIQPSFSLQQLSDSVHETLI